MMFNAACYLGPGYHEVTRPAKAQSFGNRSRRSEHLDGRGRDGSFGGLRKPFAGVDDPNISVVCWYPVVDDNISRTRKNG